jgi:hypothetical protein
MASDDDTARICREIGARIASRMAELKIDDSRLAYKLAVGIDSVRKYRAGSYLRQFVKLIEIADALQTTPNQLLGVGESAPQPPEGQSAASEREAFRGLLEAVVLALSELPLEEARPAAQAALELLDSPALRNTRIPQADIARILGAHVIPQLLTPEREGESFPQPRK